MHSTSRTNGEYRDLELDWESGSESSEIVVAASQARAARRRKTLALVGIVAIAAAVCLLPAAHARGASPSARPLAGTVNLNGESGMSPQSTKDTEAEVEHQVAEKLQEALLREKLGDDGLETVKKARGYTSENAERAHTHSAENVKSASDYAADNVQQASDYADAVFHHAMGSYNSSCIEDNTAYHPLDMRGQHISHEKDINGCLKRCKKTKGCAHFTFFHAGGSCHVTDDKAPATSKSAGAYAGTPECEHVVFTKMTPAEHAAKSSELAHAYARQSHETATAYNEGNVKRTHNYTQENLDKAKAFAGAHVPELKALAEATAPKVPASREKSEEPLASCIEDEVAYHPLDMLGQPVTYEKDIHACMSRCKETEGCVHFTYFRGHGGCHVTDDKAVAARHSAGAEAGNPECDAIVFMQ